MPGLALATCRSVVLVVPSSLALLILVPITTGRTVGKVGYQFPPPGTLMVGLPLITDIHAITMVILGVTPPPGPAGDENGGETPSVELGNPGDDATQMLTKVF